MINLVSYNVSHGDRVKNNRTDIIKVHYDVNFENEKKVKVYLGDYIFNTEKQYQILNLKKGRYWSVFGNSGIHQLNNIKQITTGFVEPQKLVFIDDETDKVINEYKLDIKFVDYSLKSRDPKKINAWIIGDSHIGHACKDIEYNELEYDTIKINPISKMGLTMSRFANSDYMEFLSCLPIMDDDLMIFNLGEIDMRVSVHVKSLRKGINKKNVLKNIVLKYLESIKKISKKYDKNKIIILRPNLPISDNRQYSKNIIKHYFLNSNESDRLELNNYFHNIVTSFCNNEDNIQYIDNSSQYGLNGFINDNLLIENDIHMKTNKTYFDSLYKKLKIHTIKNTNIQIIKIDNNEVHFTIKGFKNKSCDVKLYHKETNLILHHEKNWVINENLIYFFRVNNNIIEYINNSVLEVRTDETVNSVEVNFGHNKDFVFDYKNLSNNDTSFYTYWEIFIDEIYVNENIKINENDVVLDIGSNIGLFALYAKKFNPKHIYCLEPDSKNYFSLLKNTIKEDRITCLNFAVADKCCDISFSNAEDGVCSAISECKDLFNNVNYYKEKNVSAIDINTLLEIIKEDKIDYLKLDCEGCEKLLFESIKDETINKIKNIVIEYHSEDIKNNIISYLIDKNFVIDNTFELMGTKKYGMIYAYNKNLNENNIT